MLPELLKFQRDFASAIDRPAVGAMAVYRNTVLHGTVEALRANFPVVELILGTEMFEQAAVDFAVERPPRQAVLALYGIGFADWLEQQPWSGDLPYLGDVARVERLRVECLMAADAKPLSEEEVRRECSSKTGALGLHPAVRFAWLATPAMSLWLAHQRPITSGLAPEWKAEGALFTRPDPFVLHSQRIGAAGQRLLSGIRLGESLDRAMTAAEKLCGKEEDCTAVLASLIHVGVFIAPKFEGRRL